MLIPSPIAARSHFSRSAESKVSKTKSDRTDSDDPRVEIENTSGLRRYTEEKIVAKVSARPIAPLSSFKLCRSLATGRNWRLRSL